MPRKLFSVALLILFLLQPLFYSHNPSYDKCCVSQVQLPFYVLASDGYINVNVSEAKQMMESIPDLVIVDVRDQRDYESGHIPDAVSIPINELEERIDELNKERPTLVYCYEMLCWRSRTACQILADNGFVSVYKLLGGITAWRDSGYWIEMIHQGDLIIDGFEPVIIENCVFSLEANVYVNEYGKLVIRNAELRMSLEYFCQYGFYAEDYGILEFYNVTVISDHTFEIRGFDFSKIIIRGLDTTVDGASIFTHAQSEAYVAESNIRGLQYKPDIQYGQVPPKVQMSNCTVGCVELWFQRGDTVMIHDLNPGFVEHLDFEERVSSGYDALDFTLNNTLVEEWRPTIYSDSDAVISDSEIWIGIIIPPGLPVQLDNLLPGFYEEKHMAEITLYRTELEWISIHLPNSSATITNSMADLHPTSDSSVTLTGSVIPCFHNDHFFGSLCLDNTTWTGGIMTSMSQFYIRGNVSFRDFYVWRNWTFRDFRVELYSCKITRNYNVNVRNESGDPVEIVELTLFDHNDTVVWNGANDGSGKANFNLTFTDMNYTDTLRLEAVKGDYSATRDIGFISDTPIVLTMRYFTDLNADGTINIVDISIVAVAFGSTPEDPDWNVIADLNNDEVINILDIATVAVDFGKNVQLVIEDYSGNGNF